MKTDFQTRVPVVGTLGYVLLGIALTSCSSDEPMAAPSSEPAVVVAPVPNGSFENGMEGWSVQGDASAAVQAEGGCEGTHALAFGASSAYDVTVGQTLEGLEDGFYDLEFYYQNGGGQTACYVSAGTNETGHKMTSLQVSPDVWTRSYVRGIKVTDGKCTVEIRSQADAGEWSRLDALRLVKTDKDFNLLKGGDISELTYLEQNGARWYDNRQEKDCIELLKDNGFNIVRLRLYNDPGNPDYSPSNRLPAGIQNEEDILRLAKRAKDAGLQIQLTFHYSDYWTNGEDQNKPHEWEGLTFEEMKQALYDFTFGFMTRMAAQGTTPEFVSLGNESQAGMLYPDGNCTDGMPRLCELYNAGYEAVKAVAPESKVIIHSNAAGDREQYNWYFGELQDRGVKYDVIGASYYPFFTDKKAAEIREWADYIAEKFDKDILLMEVGYAWNPTLPDGKTGQLGHNGPYPEMTKPGQKNFMLELMDEIKKSENCRILGLLYWDPIFIECGDLGWELGADNVVSNTTLFDFDGNALEVFDAFKYNN